jgi:arylsulfatase A-like enzyme
MSSPTAAPERPNVLLLMGDQHCAHMLSCAGSPHVATPALDALASGGTRFTRAYTTFPLCVPARASLVTGRFPHELGIHGNVREGTEPARTPESMGHLMRAAGYDAAYAGKWHARQPSASPEDGFEVVAPFGDRGLAQAASDWLRTRRRQPRPFMLVVSFDDPHSICEYARSQPMPYGDIGPLPNTRDLPALPANHAATAYEPQALRLEQQRAAAMYGTLQFGPDDWRRYRHTYARLVERTDAHVGVVLRGLEEAGLAEDTIVVYTSDHGDGDASHQWNQKTALYEETCKVPLIVRDPRRTRQVSTSAALVSVGTDLLPTIATAGKIEPADRRITRGGPSGPAFVGTDLLGLLDGAPAHREVVVETAFESPAGAGTLGRALITDRYKYVVYGWGANREQLFDLVLDPGEVRNLAAESAFDPVLDDLRARLLEWCRRTKDSTFLKRLALPAAASPQTQQEIFAVPY